MVDSRAWMVDHKPQKKCDARENLERGGVKKKPKITTLFPPVRDVDVRRRRSPVDLHVQLLHQLQLLPLAQAAEPPVGLAQVAPDEVQLRRDTHTRDESERRR